MPSPHSLTAAVIAAVLLLSGSAMAQANAPKPTPVQHPFLLFSQSDVPALASRKDADPLLAECWDRMETLAKQPDNLDRWSHQLEARAFLWQMTQDPTFAESGLRLMMAALKKETPAQYYDHAEFHYHAAPLRALAMGWDWLYDQMTPEQRREILPGLERWLQVALDFTDKQWWREASYNVGAIPVGGIGTLAVAIRPDSTAPITETCYREATRRIGQNFFPLSWKPSGICWEGPNYAIVGLRYTALFAEVLRRSGGPDLMAESGALKAMDYLTYQWLPWGECASIGDNTTYGRRTFAAEYLLGVDRLNSAAGLWTWRTHTDVRRLDTLITYLWYPLTIEPVSPSQADWPTSRYFEVTLNRAGYLFARTSWDTPDAAFFAFTTRYEKQNHQHYDMNAFLLGAYGTLFATHADMHDYGDENHGVDYEHNMVIVNGGGWPKYDNKGSCGDENSTKGMLVGLATGPFADYVRGDAKWSYCDNSIPNANPAIRAERACLFVKDGPTPYLMILDDQQYTDKTTQYDWQWHAPSLPIAGAGTLSDPLTITAEQGRCAIRFVTPTTPAITVKPVDAPRKRYQGKFQRIAVRQDGVRVRYAALATLEKDPSAAPTVQAVPVTCDNPSASAIRIDWPNGMTDTIAWQSEEDLIQLGQPLTAGPLKTDGLLAMVRVQGHQVLGYVLGEGTRLQWRDASLAQADGSVCVTAGGENVNVNGRLRTREGVAPVDPGHIRAVTPAKFRPVLGAAAE